MSKVTLLPLLFFIVFKTLGIEAIDNNTNHLYFLDSAVVYQHDLSGLKLQNKWKVSDDTAFIQAFYKLKHHEDADFNRVKRRLRIANYLNLTCYNDKVFIAARFFSLDTSKQGWEYMLIEYSEELEFRNMYILKQASSPRFGRVEIYPRFKLLFNTRQEVLLTVSVPPDTKGRQDSAYNFAVFAMDAKRSELRFKRSLKVATAWPRMKTIVFNNYPKGLLTYPVKVPIEFTEHPAYFSFPYMIINNFKGTSTYDPLYHVQYAIDSSKRLDGNMSDQPLGVFFNALNTTALVRAYNYQNGALKFILSNWMGRSNTLAEVQIANGKESVRLLVQDEDFKNKWFHYAGDQIVVIKTSENGYELAFMQFYD